MATIDEAITIAGLRLRNRLVFPPIHSNFATAEGEIIDSSLGYYEQRVRDVGLAIVEVTTVRADGRITPYTLGLWSDKHLPGMARLAATIKRAGAAAVVQLAHGGARSVPVAEGIRAASPGDFLFRTDAPPTPLSAAQIAEFVQDFAAAAERAASAGFDGVEVHGAHLYLLSQFLSPLTNRRTDRYGGDAAGRATIVVEVVQAIRARLGRSYPILVRLNAFEAPPGGQTIAEAITVARLLEATGVDVLDVSAVGQLKSMEAQGRRYLSGGSALGKTDPPGGLAPYAAQIKRAVGIPVIAVGKLGYAGIAARVVGEGMADMVAIARQMICDPQTAGKLLAGRGDTIVRCKECGGCSISALRNYKPMRCAQNKNLTGEPRYRLH